jgi:hypothetical protein
MSDPSTKEHVPTPEELEREARRLARVRHLTLVPETQIAWPVERTLTQELDPGPEEAA